MDEEENDINHLGGCEAFHVGGLEQACQVVRQVCHCCVDGHLVLPLKLCPHGSELCLCAGGRHDVVHDVNVDVIQHNHVAVAGSAAHIVNNVPKDYSILS